MRNRFLEVIAGIIRPIVHIVYPYRIRGAENLPEGGAILCPNHVSMVDPVQVVLAMGWRPIVRIMGKAELFQKKLLNWFFRKLGVFPVNRGGNDLTAMKTALKSLQDGYKLLMFPEGTRVKEGEEGDAKGGAILFATRTGVPIVPIYCGSQPKLFRRSTVIFGEPYYPKFAGRRPTAEEIKALSEELLEKIYALKETV